MKQTFDVVMAAATVVITTVLFFKSERGSPTRALIAMGGFAVLITAFVILSLLLVLL